MRIKWFSAQLHELTAQKLAGIASSAVGRALGVTCSHDPFYKPGTARNSAQYSATWDHEVGDGRVVRVTVLTAEQVKAEQEEHLRQSRLHWHLHASVPLGNGELLRRENICYSREELSDRWLYFAAQGAYVTILEDWDVHEPLTAGV